VFFFTVTIQVARFELMNDILSVREVVPTTKRGLRGKGRAYGKKCAVLLAKYDQDSLLWRTSQTCLTVEKEGGLAEFSGTWPRSGMMRNGIVYRLPPLVPRMSGKEYGSWPTPQASDNRKVISTFGSCLRSKKAIPELGTLDGWINPVLSEWLMGYPDNWTDLSDVEIQSFHK